MGMGYGANFAVTVNELFLEKVAPEAYADMERLEPDYGHYLRHETVETINNGAFLREIMPVIERENDMTAGGEEMVNILKLVTAIQNVMTQYRKATGLPLYVGNHDSDNQGSRYDDVDGLYFAVAFADAYQLTPQMEKAKEAGADIGLSYYVTYG